MKNILLIGVGGTGSNAVDMLYRKIEALGKNSENRIVALVFDTDKAGVEQIDVATPIPMTDIRRIGTIVRQSMSAEYLEDWFPYQDENVLSQELVYGAAQWRKKSYFAFCNLMTKPDLKAAFHNAMDSLRDTNTSASYEIFTIASIAGGTGSGSFIPITLYAKRYIKQHLGKDALSTAVVACPDIYEAKMTSADNRKKIYSNAYAILRELNAINLVTHGYNDPAKNTAEHRPPVRLKIGHKNSPVGVLFDSSDRDYWHPAAAPFDKVFLLDKIPGLNSVQAHDIVLSNSLYTVLCTEIGASIDSEVSNHAMLNSQSNGYNAIYAGIATSELRYPAESVLNYMAHRKALEATDEEWVLLHRATEERIREEQKLAKEARRIYTENEGDYADKYLLSVTDQKDLPDSNLTEIIRRGTEKITVKKDEKTGENVATSVPYLNDYISALISELEGKIPEASARAIYAKADPFGVMDRLPRFGGNAEREERRSNIVQGARKADVALLSYYKECAQKIRNSTNSLSDNILTFDMHKDLLGNEILSVVRNILMVRGKYIHPVAAMVQLCSLQKRLREKMDRNFEAWKDLRHCDTISALPATFYKQSSEDGIEVASRNGMERSGYFALNEDRLYKIARDSSCQGSYKANRRSDVMTDALLLRQDILESFDAITRAAKAQLINIVLQEVCHRLQLLITHYRRFFGHLEEEKAVLRDKTEATLRKDSGVSGSVINVASDAKAKQQMFDQLNDVDAAPSMDDIVNTEHIAGKGVFDIVYATAQSEADHVDAKANKAVFSSLFDGMVAAYRDQIAHSSAYQKLESRNVFEVIADACGKQASSETILKAEEQEMRRLIELARPSLMVDSYSPDDNTPPPSTVTVVLMSSKIAVYLKRNAANFGLLIDNDQSEKSACRSCAEQFIVNAGGYGARVAVVDELPANVVYVTSEIIDVQPMHIGKINETSANPVYFKSYQQAVQNIDKYNTDMWNPHLGFNWHKRGYLPYINPALEVESDKKLMKALLYCIMEGKITYHQPLRQALAFRYFKNGVEHQINDMDGQIVNLKNMSALLAWLRPQAELIEEWSASFDMEVKNQCNKLPPVASSDDIAALEAQITKSEYIKMMREALFDKISDNSGKTRMSLIEFAYAIKTSEESSADCDDAEKILSVAYETFCKYCGFRLPKDKDPGKYAGVYMQQLEKFYEALMAGVEQTLATGEDGTAVKAGRARAKENVLNLVEWVNASGCFRSIPTDNMLDAQGNIKFVNYKFEEKKAKAKAAETAATPTEA